MMRPSTTDCRAYATWCIASGVVISGPCTVRRTVIVRVSDVRNFGGERYVYRLVAREATPDFAVNLEGVNPTIAPGSGRNFIVRVNRIDEFDGPVRVDFSDVPAGFVVSSPIVVEAGHTEAKGTIYAAADAKSPDPKAPAVKREAEEDWGR